MLITTALKSSIKNQDKVKLKVMGKVSRGKGQAKYPGHIKVNVKLNNQDNTD